MKNMDLLKKGIYTFAAAAFVAALGVGIDVQAAVSPGDISLDMNKQEMTINDLTDDGEIKVGYGTAKTADAFKEPTVWDVFDVDGKSELKVDLSHLKNNKDNYVQIKSLNQATPVTFKITAVDKTATIKATPTYSDDAVKIVFNDTTPAKNEVSGGSIIFRTDKTAYDAFDDESVVNDYLDNGGNVYFRKAGEGGNSLAANPSSTKLEIKKRTEVIKSFDYYEGDSGSLKLPGKEIKVAIKKRPNGPNIKVDYVKGTISGPNAGSYFRQIEGNAVPSTWKKAESKINGDVATVSGESISLIGSAPTVFEARLANNKGKAPASKIGFAEIKAQETVSDFSNIVTATGSGIEYNTDGSVKKGSWAFTNTTTSASIEIFANEADVNKTKITPTISTKALFKLKAGSAGSTAVAGKLDAKKYAGQKIYIRYAGVKDTSWPTAWVEYGTVGTASGNTSSSDIKYATKNYELTYDETTKSVAVENATKYEVTEGDSFVEVNPTTGILTWKAAGTATIKASNDDGKEDTCTVVAKNKLTASNTSKELDLGSGNNSDKRWFISDMGIKLNGTLVPMEDSLPDGMTVVPEKTNIVEYNSTQRRLEAIAVGTSKVTVSYENATLILNVTVVNN